jgi:hypothetical protein
LPPYDRWGADRNRNSAGGRWRNAPVRARKYTLRVEQLIARDVHLSALPLEIYTDRHQTVNDLHTPAAK